MNDIGSYLERLNNWVNPFSDDYKNAVKGFEPLSSLEKVIIVAASIFCGLGVGGTVAFRYIVSWLYPCENSQADKVTQASETILDLSTSKPHPAEQPTGFDLISGIPLDMLLKIIEQLEENPLCSISATSRLFLDLSKDAWSGLTIKRIGFTVASIFRGNRNSWRDVVMDLGRPLVTSSKSLHVLGVQDDSWGDKPELKIVRGYARTNDTLALKQALDNLKSAGKCKQLNSRYFGATPLEIAAMHGNVESAQLLMEYGAMDALTAKWDRSKDGVNGKSALFNAAQCGRIEMVKFLLKEGARPHLNLEDRGYNLPFIPTLISKMPDIRRTSDEKEIPGKKANFLECLLLLINAWKTEVGHEAVCQHEDAKGALTEAIKNGYADIANLLFALGIRIDLSEDSKYVFLAIKEKNLEMIKFFHLRELGDLKNLRTNTGETLLHVAFALNAREILQYLIDEVKIPVDVGNLKGETYEVSGKKALEQNIRRAIVHHLETFAGLYDQISGLHIESLEECFKHNIDLNVPVNIKGQTLLHLAVEQILHSYRNGEKGIINRLLEHGANPNIADNQGTTPLERARKILFKAKGKKSSSDDDAQDKLNAENLIQKMEELNKGRRF